MAKPFCEVTQWVVGHGSEHPPDTAKARVFPQASCHAVACLLTHLIRGQVTC